MSLKCDEKQKVNSILTDVIIDKSISSNKINSNIPVNFDIKSICNIPMTSKVNICEVNVDYKILSIKKDFLVNGNKINLIKNKDYDYLLINKEYVNLCDNRCEEIRVNIVENLQIDIMNYIYIKGVFYNKECDPICFEAYGKNRDIIRNIITSDIFIPNIVIKNEVIKVIVENKIESIVTPDNLYLSPLSGCDGYMQYLLGNVYNSYDISLILSALYKKTINVIAKTDEAARVVNQFSKCMKKAYK